MQKFQYYVVTFSVLDNDLLLGPRQEILRALRINRNYL